MLGHILVCTSEDLKKNRHKSLQVDNIKSITSENVADVVHAFAPHLVKGFEPRYFFVAENYDGEEEYIDFHSNTTKLIKRPHPAHIELYNSVVDHINPEAYEKVLAKRFYSTAPIDEKICH